MKPAIAIIALASVLSAESLQIKTEKNDLGMFRTAKYSEEKSAVSGKITIFRGTDPRHIHLILNGSKESCHPYYIPGDNHVHSGVSKKGTFSITLPEGSFSSALLEFRKGESCGK